MIRTIIHIDEEKCNGCGICADACHEGAIEIIDGKAKLTREDYCDGLGDCLSECPEGAITFEKREALPYDSKAVLASKMCPGLQSMTLNKAKEPEVKAENGPAGKSQLGQWPCQIKLAPVQAPYFSNASLLIAADCTAFAYADIHKDFMAGKITLIGCPKLDNVDYSEKLAEILRQNSIKDVTIIRMEVPCCGGLEMAVKNAVKNSGKDLPCSTFTVAINGGLKN